MKTILITGGTSGIGLAIAKLFRTQGDQVIVLARKPQDMTDGIEFFQCDIQDESQVKLTLTHVLEKYPVLDVVINNAGLSCDSESDITSMPIEELQQIINTNLNGSIYIARHTLPVLQKFQGTLINIASQLGIKADPEVPIYCTTKAAIVMLTKALALRYAKDGVRVNCVCPGPTNTPLLRSYFSSEQVMRDYYKQAVPLGKVSEPEEIAQLILFLSSDHAKNMTGGIYSLDGGSYLKI